MTNAANKTVLISGAGGGFGRELVRQFRSKGAKLILTDVTERALLDVVGAAGDDLIVAIATDLASEEGCDTVVETCTSRGVVPDILVNNAGIGVAGRLDNVPRDHWESLMQLNLLAPMRLCNQFLPGMIKRGSGHIVNVSSLAGWAGAKGLRLLDLGTLRCRCADDGGCPPQSAACVSGQVCAQHSLRHSLRAVALAAARSSPASPVDQSG
jgi:NAD(P)-dependent dehydrogenase (short-subunit alcohol dehydrogenase family)